MQDIVGAVAGLILIILTWWVVPAIFSVTGLDAKHAPEGVPEDFWDALRNSGSESAGNWLGALERIVGALAYWSGTYQIIAGWYAFKVASKWQSWSGVLRLPSEFPGIDPVSYVRARRVWSANLLMRFLIGSLTNVLLGMLSAWAGQLIANAVISAT